MTAKRKSTLVDLVTKLVQESKRIRDAALDETLPPEARIEACLACLDASGLYEIPLDKMTLDGLKLLKLQAEVELALREAYKSDAPLSDTPEHMPTHGGLESPPPGLSGIPVR
jgi:hypothetical protein